MSKTQATALVVFAVLAALACSPLGKPGAATAKRDFQAWLDSNYPAVWSVQSVKKIDGRETMRKGTQAYILEARVHVHVLKSMTSAGLAPGLRFAYEVIAKDKYWMAGLLGGTGDEKIVTLELLYLKKDRGWAFEAACADCDSE